MNDFQEACRYLFALGNEVSAMKLGLKNIARLLAELDRPHSRYFKVQVAGTNGKGSVCAYLGAICQAAGLHAGIYTSPHLIKITERIKIDGCEITEEQFAQTAGEIREISEGLFARGDLEYRPTYFEQITAIALSEFAKSGVEIAILETGLGGRYDATTAANSEIAVITRVDFDHQNYLGSTIEQIAAEKAAIIRRDSQGVVVGEQSQEALVAIMEQCDTVGKTPRLAAGFTIEEIGESVVFPSVSSRPVKLSLAGKHQIENAKTAILTAFELRRYFQITNDQIIEGLENARHPGRLERIGRFLLDGAHNIGGARALRYYLDQTALSGLTVIFAAMRDKDVPEILGLLAPCVKNLVVTAAKNERSLSVDDLAGLAAEVDGITKIYSALDLPEAKKTAEEITPENDIILVTGSLYLIGEFKSIFDEHTSCK